MGIPSTADAVRRTLGSYSEVSYGLVVGNRLT